MGVHHIIHLNQNRGLAHAFVAKLETVLKTEANNQYRGQDVGLLAQLILEKRIDIVVGD